MKTILVGILGGVVMFIWSAIAHVALPIGTMGLSTLTAANEDAVFSAMKNNIPQPGLYFMPGMDMTKTPTDAEQAAFNTKYTAGPTAFLVYHPIGQAPMSPKQLGSELLATIIAGIFAAFVLASLHGSWLQRALLIGSLGVFAWFSLSASQWIWYRFPGAFVGGEFLDQVIGWLLAGLVMAKILKPVHQ